MAERSEASGRPAEPPAQRPPGVVDHQVEPVQRAPCDEGPGGAVPEPAEQHGEEEVAVAPRRAVPVAAERDIEVVAQETRQRHVPAPPEIDDIDGLVWRIEIERQSDSEAARRPDRHVGIAGEIVVELKPVGERAAPGLDQSRIAAAGGGVEYRRGVEGDGTGR